MHPRRYRYFVSVLCFALSIQYFMYLYNASLSQEGDTPLRIASAKGLVDVVRLRLLLDCGSNKEALDEVRCRP